MESDNMDTDKIRDMELEALELSNERNQFTEKAIKIKTASIMGFELEWEEHKDKSLSNQTKRNSASDEELEGDEEYQILASDITTITNALRELEINISFEKRQFKRETNHTTELHEITTSLQSIAAAMRTFGEIPDKKLDGVCGWMR